MIQIITILIAAGISAFALYMLLSFTAALARVRRAGVQGAGEFRRAGVTAKNFREAKVPRQDSSSLISTRAGVSLRSTSHGLKVQETRTIAKDVF